MAINMIFITTLTLLISFFSSISLTLAASNYELAIQVCNDTPDSKSCMNTFNSNPTFQPSATADRVTLAYIAFGNAYLAGTNTQTNIMSNITRIGVKRSVNLHGLQNCQGYYTSAVNALYQVLESLDSDMYCNFDTLSATAQSNATACGNGLRRRQVTLARENGNFFNLAGICFAVAKLFVYSC